MKPILDKMRNRDLAGLRADFPAANPFGSKSLAPLAKSGAVSSTGTPLTEPQDSALQRPQGQGWFNPPQFGGFNPPRFEPFWERNKSEPEYSFASSPLASHLPEMAEAGMVSEDVQAAFMERMPEELAAAYAAEQQQTNAMNRLRQQWFDEWKNMMYGGYANMLSASAGGRGLF